MDRVSVIDQFGSKKEVEVVRYFSLNGNKYLVYSLGEIDDAGHSVLYVSKEGSQPMLPDEWPAVQGVFNGIVKSNRTGAPLTVEDLDYKNINFVVKKDKIFKVPTASVAELSANKKSFDVPSIPNNLDQNINIPNELNNVPSFNVDMNNNLEQTMELPKVNLDIPSFNSQNVNQNINEEKRFGVPSFDVPSFNQEIPDMTINKEVNSILENNQATPEEVIPSTNNIAPIAPVNSQVGVEANINSNPFGQFNNITSYNDLVSATEKPDYKTLYEEEKQKADELSNQVNSLKLEIDDINKKLESIKQIIG